MKTIDDSTGIEIFTEIAGYKYEHFYAGIHVKRTSEICFDTLEEILDQADNAYELYPET